MILNDLIEKQKINVVCKELGYEDNSKLYLAMHYAWERGMTSEESYTAPHRRKEEDLNDPQGDKLISMWIHSALDAGYTPREFKETIRITTNDYYRRNHFEKYLEIRENIKGMTLVDVVFKTLKM